jgi:hypothetical protein
MKFWLTKTLLSTLAVFFCSVSTASAGLIISFNPSDLIVNPTGGMVVQSVDMFITHDGVGSNVFSVYEIELNPASRVAIAEGPITTSDFVFDLGHQVVSSAPWSILGANNATNNTVTFDGTDLLARLTLSIDTSAGVPSSIDLQPTMLNATRGGILGTVITSEFTITPASLIITAVPEPSSFALVAMILLTACNRRHGRRRPHAEASRL